MKPLLLWSLLLGCAFAQAQPLKGEEKPLVVATASMFADMATVIGGGMVDVRSVVPIGGDPHIYDPTPADVRLVAAADLILRNGLTFEGWLNEVIANSGTEARVVTVTNGIQPIESEQYQNSADPHAWMSAANGLIYARNVRDALVALDPDNADVYEFNYGIYRQQIEDLDREIEREIATIPTEQRVLITSHDAFRYYGRRYGIRVEAALGTSTDADVQTSDVARLTRIIRESGVPAIFVESTINPKLIRQIDTDNGVRIGGSLFADSLGDPAGPAGTYLKMLRHNTRQIVSALRGDRNLEAEIDPGPTGAQQLILLGIIIALMAGSFSFMVYRLNRAL
jgi:ABC-type Zn uptake system ZnuABC Zn-binding protein ZnuA